MANKLIDKNNLERYSITTKSGCMEWTRSKSSDGYGHVRVGSILVSVHRLIYIKYHGDIKDNLHVLHSCDNPACININHLSLGTHAENMRQRHARGRRYLK